MAENASKRQNRIRGKGFVNFQDPNGNDTSTINSNFDFKEMKSRLKSSLAALYQDYDFVTEEYDKLFNIVDILREAYNDVKGLFMHQKYHEYKRMIKNTIRQWRLVEKKNSMANFRRQSSINAAMLNELVPKAMAATTAYVNARKGSYSTGMGGTFASNINARLLADKDEVTRELYEECTRLEKEIFHYRARNQQIKNILCKLAVEYDSSKQHVLHIWGRYKELGDMLKEVINSDI